LRQATELIGLLQQSPSSLPFSPRIIYTTSSTTELSDFDGLDPAADPQLLRMSKVYAPSKYAGDLLIDDLDRRYGRPSADKRAVRALCGEPGCVATNAAKDWMMESPLYGFLQAANLIVFLLVCSHLSLARETSLTTNSFD
jgi:3-keto steroid reductase